jgi:hypothetical protein
VANNWSDHKWAWLLTGVGLGLVLANYWPHEPLAYADSTSVSGQKFGMCTVQTAPGEADAIFVLDYSTGRLIGAVFNNTTNQFAQPMLRTVAQDFGLRETGQYVMVTGFVGAQATGGSPPPALGGVYVAELNSGKLALYGFLNSPQAGRTPQELSVLGVVPWRQSN